MNNKMFFVIYKKIKKDVVEIKVKSSEEVCRYLWDFGDGNLSLDDSPSHTFNNAGKYDVNLSVYTKTRRIYCRRFKI